MPQILRDEAREPVTHNVTAIYFAPRKNRPQQYAATHTDYLNNAVTIWDYQRLVLHFNKCKQSLVKGLAAG